MNKGLTHIYTGDGKGKTTAAMGLALRAAGCGLTVRVFAFCKGAPSGEWSALSTFPRVSVQRANCETAMFLSEMPPELHAQYVEAQQALFDDACEAAGDPDNDLVILDEAFAAMRAGAMDVKQLLYLMNHKCRGVELVLTGRGAPASLTECADYVTEMRAIRHPLDHGTHARKGIEY